jgi:hypothetical protein
MTLRTLLATALIIASVVLVSIPKATNAENS